MMSKWQKVKIGDFFEVTNGKTNSDDAVLDGAYPLFDRSIEIKRSNKFLFDTEAIIIPGEGKEFIPQYYFGKFDLHQRAYAIYQKGKDKLIVKFLYYWIEYNKAYLSKMAVGSTVKSLRLYMLQNFPLELPNYKIQLRIVDILSSIDEAIQKTDQIILKKKELKKGMLDQLTNTGNGKSIKLEDVIKIKNGFAYSGKNMVDSETNTVILTPGNVVIGGGFNFSKLRYYFGEVIRDYVLKPGDIFIALTDLTPQANFLGYPAIVPDLKNKTFLHNQRLGLIQLTSANVDLMFIYFLLMTFNYRQHVVSTASGTTVKHTSVPKIIDYKFDLPTLDVQKEMVEKLRLIEHDLKTEKETKDFYCELKKGLMHDIFSQKVQIN